MRESPGVEEKIPADHPLRTITVPADEGLVRLSPKFEAAGTDFGRPSIPPEQRLKALHLRALVVRAAYSLVRMAKVLG